MDVPQTHVARQIVRRLGSIPTVIILSQVRLLFATILFISVVNMVYGLCCRIASTSTTTKKNLSLLMQTCWTLITLTPLTCLFSPRCVLTRRICVDITLNTFLALVLSRLEVVQAIEYTSVFFPRTSATSRDEISLWRDCYYWYVPVP